MEKTLKNVEYDKCTLQDLEYGKKTENVENEKDSLQDLEYGNKTEKLVNGEMHTVGTGKWRTKLKKSGK